MERERLIVAVDFGTTYSGVAFCHSTQNGLKDSEVINTWANNEVAPKTPTEIRYIEGKEALWGAEASFPCERRQVKNTAHVYNRFKLLLDPTIEGSVYTNPTDHLAGLRLQNTTSIRLPPGKTAIEVSTDYLRLLYKELMNKKLRKRFPDTLDVTPIEFVFTIPAIWGHKAQEATRYAAKTAGFGNRPVDNVSLVAEPEAAAMFVLQAMRDEKFSRISTPKTSLKKGENFVICDAGGGTVDLISYEVEQDCPKLSLKESAVGTGGKCGSSYIDAEFVKFLRKKLGPDFKDEDCFRKLTECGSTLMKTFDRIKKSFGDTNSEIWFLELGVDVPDNEETGIMDNELEFTAQHLKDLFDPVVEKVIGLVEDQVNTVRSQKGPDAVSTVFLVGGFGESHYLYHRLVEWAEKRTPPLVVVNPTESWSAIMRGAIIHTLQPLVRSRRLRQHYGFKCGLPFDCTKHDISEAYESPFGGWYIRDSILWAANMGDECDTEKEISFPVRHLFSDLADLKSPTITTLYGCKSAKTPTFCWEHAVYHLGALVYDFSSVDVAELDSTTVIEAGTRRCVKYSQAFLIKMKIGSADAKFSVWLKNKCLGRARISHNLEDEGEYERVSQYLIE